MEEDVASNRVERSKTIERRVDAERFAAEITSDVGRGDYLDPRAGQVVLEKWATTWLSTLNVKPKTRASYESLLRSRILPAFGRRPARQHPTLGHSGMGLGDA